MGRTYALSTMVEDQLGRNVRICLHVIVPQSQNRPTLALQELRPPGVIFRCSVHVLATIQLDRQLRFPACEIDNEGIDDELTGKTRAILPPPQP